MLERVELVDLGRRVVDGIELVAPGALQALDAAVELGRARRQDVERDALLLAGGLELGHELRAAVDLDGGELEGQLGDELVEEAGGGGGGGAMRGHGDAPAREPVDGGELLDALAAGEAQRQRVDLHRLAGPGGLEGAAQPPRPAAPRLRRGAGRPPEQRHGHDPPEPHQMGEDAAYGGVGHGEALRPQDRPELALAPDRVVGAQPLHRRDQRRRPAPPARTPRSARPHFRPLLPTIERGARHADRLGGRRRRQPPRHCPPPGTGRDVIGSSSGRHRELTGFC